MLYLKLDYFSSDSIPPNQTHLVVLNFCFERLHHVTLSHDKARSNRWCQWHVLFRTTYKTVRFFKWDSVRNFPVSIWVRAQVYSTDANFLYDQSTFFSRLTDEYINLLKLVLEPRTVRSAVRCREHSDTQCIHVIRLSFSRMYNMNELANIFENPDNLITHVDNTWCTASEN